MQHYDAIENGILNHDIKALRETIGSICYTSRDFSSGEFDEVVKYVESKGIKIKDDSLVGSPTISSQKSSFTDQDFAKAIFELKKNFCDERINDVKTIGKKLYGKLTNLKISEGTNDKQNVSSRESVNGTNPNHASHQQKKNLVTIAMAVVAVIVVITVAVLLIKR